MKEKYKYTLTVPLSDIDEALLLLGEAQANNRNMRLSRKSDRQEKARFHLSFPGTGSRMDLQFIKWFIGRNKKNRELFGPNHGAWGLT